MTITDPTYQTLSASAVFELCVHRVWRPTYNCDGRGDADAYSHLLSCVKGMFNDYIGFEDSQSYQACFYEKWMRRDCMDTEMDVERHVNGMDRALETLAHVAFPQDAVVDAKDIATRKARKELVCLYISIIKEYVSMLHDGERLVLLNNLGVDYESGEKPKLSVSSGVDQKPAKKARLVV
jgi:hypothetical protein